MFSVTEVLEGVGGVFKPLNKLVDNVHTSSEEKLTLRNELVRLQNEVAKGQMELLGKAMDLEREALKAQQAVLTTEASSDSWLTANWRPITMVVFVAVTTLHSLGFIEMSEVMSMQYFGLVKLGLGGYIASRGIEKAAPAIAKAVKS